MQPKRKQNRTVQETNNAVSSDTLLVQHSGVLGIAALIKAYPYDVPAFLPEYIMFLTKYANSRTQFVRETVKKTFTTFWNMHRDRWFMIKKQFSEDQLMVLNELLISPSYYA